LIKKIRYLSLLFCRKVIKSKGDIKMSKVIAVTSQKGGTPYELQGFVLISK